MDPILVGFLSLLAVLLLIFARVPIAMALMLVSFFGIYAIVGVDSALSMVTAIPYSFSASWTLSSVPMFLLMGFVAYHTGMTRGLFEAARAWLGWLPGGLAISSIGGASGFAAVTGSSVACSAAIGRIAIPEMHRNNYDVRVATGAVAAGGTIGALIPPSILLIIFGIQAEVSINKLFAGGLIVGLISMFLYFCVVWFVYWRSPESLPLAEGVKREERLAATLAIWPVLVLILVVFGGLFGGLFTATEAGAVGALATIIIGVLRKELQRERFVSAISDTLLASGSLFMIVIGATLFTRLIALTGISWEIADWIDSNGFSLLVILLVITFIYLALGMFLEPIGAMLLTLPLFLPLLADYGIDKVWFGLLVAKLLEIGMITPPVGLNVFVIHSVAKDYVTLEKIFRGVFPFIVADLILVALMLTYQQL
ncbi:TRAP transporter large permease [Marinobacterium mangrovicola]|uniref:TRAP transporter large permease protein n=1 Tax=Marinobacterium mangrovicola TaxID=1476959 RepID=A0A4R1GBZ2_9GAMM|nr:TRAP transporter large permease [Marinobacterium mangrovicola]TCK04323.1 tripartite ATP-independent transporter DctM subunit [Marinobacterium mangrovicola]